MALPCAIWHLTPITLHLRQLHITYFQLITNYRKCGHSPQSANFTSCCPLARTLLPPLQILIYSTLQQALWLEVVQLHLEFCSYLSCTALSPVTYPLDVVRRRMQMKGISGALFNYSSTWNAFSTIVQVEGPRGLYKGMWPNLLKVGELSTLSR